MDFAIARMSTKGQIVIPSFMREGLNPGDEMLLVRDNERLVLKSVKSMAKDLQKDLKFAERVERVWQKHERGELVTVSGDEFLRRVDKALGLTKAKNRRSKPDNPRKSHQ